MEKNKQISLAEQKEILLGILIDVDTFCKANNLQYFLACGSLIGAVRNNGFIPWDDDIDIFMKRDDYERFIRIYNSDVNKQYYVVSRETNKDFYLPYAKVNDNRTTLREHK